MYELVDEIIIEGNGLRWLIWIQLLVLFLLILLLYYFGVFAFTSSGAGDSQIICSSSPFSLGLFVCREETIQEEIVQARGNEAAAGERAKSTSNRTERAQSISERDGSSLKDVPPSRIPKQFHHPCHYLELARRAFLGCLGLGSAPQNPRAREKEE
ncbi:hypothetical protein Ancab_002994 [Ancistrocladus abbreviatus]